MKLYGLYLEQDLPQPTDASVAGAGVPGIEDKGKTEAAKKQVDGMTTDLKRSLRGVVESLKRLPVMETRTEARDAVELMMKSFSGFMESFSEGGSNFDAIFSAIMAGGK